MSEIINNEATVANETVKLTREQKLRLKYDSLVEDIKAKTEKANEIAEELNSLTALANVGVGSKVLVKQGRAETTRIVEGTVSAVKDEEDGAKVFKVLIGEGFDAELVVVSAAKISLPAVEPSEPAEA